MSAQERDEPPDDDPPVHLTDAVEEAMEPELRRSLAPLPEEPGQDRARPPQERGDAILDDLRQRGEE